MTLKQIEVPPEWDYLFNSVYIRHIPIYRYSGDIKPNTFNVNVFGFLKPEHVKVYQALCAIDTDFKLESNHRTALINEKEFYIRANILPFSERFFVPNIEGFSIPMELVKKLEELLQRSKPIT